MKLTHIGYVVKNIDDYLTNSFLKAVSPPVYDPVQKSKICFVDVGWDDEVLLELLEPSDSSSPVANFLQKTGGGLHHLCFEVKDITEAEDIARKSRMVPVREAVPR